MADCRPYLPYVTTLLVPRDSLHSLICKAILFGEEERGLVKSDCEKIDGVMAEFPCWVGLLVLVDGNTNLQKLKDKERGRPIQVETERERTVLAHITDELSNNAASGMDGSRCLGTIISLHLLSLLSFASAPFPNVLSI